MSSRVTSNTRGVDGFHARSYSAKTAAEHAAIYDEWAATFDDEMKTAAHDYVGPETAVAAVFKALSPSPSTPGRELEILDAGCGTGIQAVKFFQHPAANNVKLCIDGVDVSSGMLNVARKTGLYRSLTPVDLTQPIKVDDGKYDIVICVGTLTYGHVGPEALREFVRVLKTNGIAVATVIDEIWASGGYEAEVESLREEGKVDVLATALDDYRRGAGQQARYLVLKVL